MTGKMNVINVPKRIASPNNIVVIPKYIGWRLMQKGPVIISDVGIPSDFIVVPFFLNKEKAQIAIMSPKIIRTIPE